MAHLAMKTFAEYAPVGLFCTWIGGLLVLATWELVLCIVRRCRRCRGKGRAPNPGPWDDLPHSQHSIFPILVSRSSSHASTHSQHSISPIPLSRSRSHSRTPSPLQLSNKALSDPLPDPNLRQAAIVAFEGRPSAG